MITDHHGMIENKNTVESNIIQSQQQQLQQQQLVYLLWESLYIGLSVCYEY